MAVQLQRAARVPQDDADALTFEIAIEDGLVRDDRAAADSLRPSGRRSRRREQGEHEGRHDTHGRHPRWDPCRLQWERAAGSVSEPVKESPG